MAMETTYKPSVGLSDDERTDAEELYVRNFRSAASALGNFIKRISVEGLERCVKGLKVPSFAELNIPQTKSVPGGRGSLEDPEEISVPDLLSPRVLQPKLNDPLLRASTLNVLATVTKAIDDNLSTASSAETEAYVSVRQSIQSTFDSKCDLKRLLHAVVDVVLVRCEEILGICSKGKKKRNLPKLAATAAAHGWVAGGSGWMW